MPDVGVELAAKALTKRSALSRLVGKGQKIGGKFDHPAGADVGLVFGAFDFIDDLFGCHPDNGERIVPAPCCIGKIEKILQPVLRLLQIIEKGLDQGRVFQMRHVILEPDHFHPLVDGVKFEVGNGG